jgi:hypothetical protein
VMAVKESQAHVKLARMVRNVDLSH